ncbi:MAG: PLP-dependent aminotransferase family protein [Caldilineaceae bacterium]|nr:PLP-dependent aminotransferase family protein [Caldilineaceae bacterium]
MSSPRTTQVDRASDRIDFGIGQPGFDLLPQAMLARAAADRFAEGDTDLLNYGYEQGDGRFRRALADFLSTHYGAPVSAEGLMITAGASQALDLICTQFAQPGDTVFVEEPSYFLALRILREDHQLNVISLPVDENGLIIDAVKDALARHRPAFLYTIPAFQNPTGYTLSAERRQRLIALSQEHDFMIVADEVYHLLGYGEPPPPPLASFVDQANVLSVGSFSKILAPGLRLGWIGAAPELVQRFVLCGLVDSGGGLNHFTSNIVRVALEQGWQGTYLRELRQIYGQRIAAMHDALTVHFGDQVRYRVPQGGYFFWLELLTGVDTSDLLPHAHAAGVGFVPGMRFSSQGGLRRHFRLSFAHYGEEVIQAGIARLGRVIRT